MKRLLVLLVLAALGWPPALVARELEQGPDPEAPRTGVQEKKGKTVEEPRRDGALALTRVDFSAPLPPDLSLCAREQRAGTGAEHRSGRVKSIGAAVGAGVGFGLGAIAGFQWFDGARFAERKIATTAAICAGAGALAGYFVGSRWSASQSESPAGNPPNEFDPPRFEVGGNLGTVGFLSSEGGLLMAVGPRVTLKLTRRMAVELAGDVIAPTELNALYGLYHLQVKQVVREGGRTRSVIFVTVGTGGVFEVDRVPERRQPRPDGSVVVYPAHTEAELMGPIVFSGGVGLQEVLARHAAFRAEVQVLAVGPSVLGLRGLIGISIPIGGYHAGTP